jgi:hypothetical protein
MGGEVVHRSRTVVAKRADVPVAIVVACVATVILFLPFDATALRRAMTWSLFREDPLAYALVLGPHALTMIVCIVAPGTFALGLAVGVGVLAAVGLLIVVPVWGLALSLSDKSDPIGFVLLGVILLGIQIAMVIVARADLRDARAAGLARGSLGPAVTLVYVGFLLIVAMPAAQGNASGEYLAKQQQAARAQFRAGLPYTRSRYHAVDSARASDSASITHDQANQRMLFIVSCLDLHFESSSKYPPDLLSLGPVADNCLDSVTASGKFGSWRVDYTPTLPSRGWPKGYYRLSATDTTDIEVPIYLGVT